MLRGGRPELDLVLCGPDGQAPVDMANNPPPVNLCDMLKEKLLLLLLNQGRIKLVSGNTGKTPRSVLANANSSAFVDNNPSVGFDADRVYNLPYDVRAVHFFNS
jgi:hypothetical protein